MATRAMIYLKLNPQDVGKFKKCNILRTYFCSY